jgi:sec-independent protein translocase protein TatA
MLDAFEGWHIVIILGVAVVLFGSGKLPGAARSLGQSLRIFKSEMKAAVKDEPSPNGAAVAAAPPAIQNTNVAGIVADVPAQVPVQVVAQPVVQAQAVAQPAPQNVPTQQ